MSRKLALFYILAVLLCAVTACRSSETVQPEVTPFGQNAVQTEQEAAQSDQRAGQSGQETGLPGSEVQIPDALSGQIMDQSFPVELDGFGRVVFAPFEPVSYPSENPDYGTTMFGDVRFMLLSSSNGGKLYDFPGETEDNILTGLIQFKQVLAVAFQDYNEDGRTDILLLLEYEDLSGQTSRKARAYTQDEGEKEFRIDRSLSEYLGDYTESMGRMIEGINGYWKKAVSDFGECSEWDVERFAKKVRKQILEGNYESLAKECSYPILIDGETYENEEELLASGLLQNLPQSFLDVIEKETCEDLFHNWQGYMLGNGEVWIEEILNEDLSSQGIKIIAFNNISTGQTSDSARAAYSSVLDKLYKTHILPNGTDLGYDGISDLSENQFAIYDIDQDGKEELILVWTTTYTAGMAGIVYGYNSASGILTTELFEYPMQTFYDNGVVEVGMSHNHGLAGDMDFWPYALYQYDRNMDFYGEIAKVDAWNKAYYEKNYEGKAFPDEIDADGDGVVYKITKGDEVKLMDLEEYNRWRDSFLGGAKKMEIPFVKMTWDNIQGKW